MASLASAARRQACSIRLTMRIRCRAESSRSQTRTTAAFLYIRDHRIIRQLGETGVCKHDPPISFGDINGDTPLPDGGVLVSEITGSWIDAISASGRLPRRLPGSGPSVGSTAPSGRRILIADYSRPGGLVIVDHRGAILLELPRGQRLGSFTDHPSACDHASERQHRGQRRLPRPCHRDRPCDQPHRVGVRPHGSSGSLPATSGRRTGYDFVPLDPSGLPKWAGPAIVNNFSTPRT